MQKGINTSPLQTDTFFYPLSSKLQVLLGFPLALMEDIVCKIIAESNKPRETLWLRHRPRQCFQRPIHLKAGQLFFIIYFNYDFDFCFVTGWKPQPPAWLGLVTWTSLAYSLYNCYIFSQMHMPLYVGFYYPSYSSNENNTKGKLRLQKVKEENIAKG